MKTSRRTFLKTAALTGAGLVIGFDGRRLLGAKEAASVTAFQPNGWIRLDGHGTITLTLGKSEMGQGVRTALPMILADELGADWSRIRVEQAMPGPSFKRLGTGGSGSVQGSWKPLREAAAAAREMLTQVAARQWKVDPGGCSTQAGWVQHSESGRRLANPGPHQAIEVKRAEHRPGGQGAAVEPLVQRFENHVDDVAQAIR
jgi:CO/xanthine dehydrogenase Mo-binding subunit